MIKRVSLTGTNTLGVVALAEQTMDTTNGEGETGLRRAAAISCQFNISKKTRDGRVAYDWAFLLPLALPPDLPPVILIGEI